MEKQMKFLTIRLLLLLAVCAFLAPLAHADDSVVFDTGKNVYPINTDKIRMVSEHVTIVRKNVIHGKYTSRIANVDCEFVFENITDEAQEVKVGFPGITCEENNPLCTPGLSNFVSYINGKEVPVDVKEEITGTAYIYYEMDKAGKRIPKEGYSKRNWYTWDVTFPSRGRLKLRNTYEISPGASSGGHYWYEYVLVTGANWKGTIGNATIEVIYEDENYFRRRVGKVQPSGYKVQGNRIIWEFKDFTPTEDIKIYEISDHVIIGVYMQDFIAHFNSKKYEGAERLYTRDDLINPIALHKEWLEPQSFYPLISGDVLSEDLERLYIHFLRNEIFARHGKKDITGYSPVLFYPISGIEWFKYNPNYSDDLLNDIEEQNIKFILDYEKARGWR